MTVRMANQAAGAILGTELAGVHRQAAARARPPATSGSASSWARSRCDSPPGARSGASSSISTAAAGPPHAHVRLHAAAGRRAPTSGFVIVFDDITALLAAQRDAAWGEVARRLAHEIKNPLTPIQLSAERMRRRLLAGMSERDAEILERGTRTIVQQVETMQQMVNAFSEYARAPEMQITRFSLNQLVTEVADLYRPQAPRTRIRLELD